MFVLTYIYHSSKAIQCRSECVCLSVCVCIFACPITPLKWLIIMGSDFPWNAVVSYRFEKSKN